jgi:hypothetical protein
VDVVITGKLLPIFARLCFFKDQRPDAEEVEGKSAIRKLCFPMQ